ncbi:MAG: peptidoglycan-binding protein [Propionibacteriaceae bacterium]|nr:peptidoglycan-binding protein [Propionibacteriaceae bacterium]
MKYSSRVVSVIMGVALVFGLVGTGVPTAVAATTTESAKKSFIASIVSAAQSAQRQWGVPASVSIAQAIESTDYGTSKLATQARNYFGIKCRAQMTAGGFASLAAAQVGKPYVLGAEALASNPDPKKFDCSELVEWLYSRSGNKITDLAAAQYNATKPVSGSPRTGDLVFLRNNPARSNGIGHVAVLTKKLASGDWEIIEARGRAYGVVKTTLSYWKQRSYYAGLRRSASLKFAGSEGVALASAATNYQSGCFSVTSSSGTVTKYSSYSSLSYSFKDHASSIANDSAYKAARAVIADLPAFIDAVAKVEEPNAAAAYAKTIKSLISSENLTDYDVVPMNVMLLSGAKGPKVTALQHLLAHAGSTVKATGAFDAATVTAVKAFQSTKKLTVDGEVGPITLSALISQIGSGASGSRVSALHALLSGLDYETTSGASFGAATQASVKAFQTAAGLTATGVATTNTWAKLFMALDPAPQPTVKGGATLGATLSAVSGTWGPGTVDLSYQWYRGSTAIKGATSTTYVVQPADVGTALKVAVTGTKSGYVAVTRTSTATAQVPPAALTATPIPTITGTPTVAQTLTAGPGTWGPAPVTLAYQWYRGTTAISNATTASYVVQPADAGTALRVAVTGTKPGYTTVTKSSTATAAVAKATLKGATPAIAGTRKVGATLTAGPGTWSPGEVTLSYQWYRASTAISGATKKTYLLTKADKGAKITVRVRGTLTGYVTLDKRATVSIA